MPLVLYLFLLVSLVWLWAGLHMGYRYLWMLILYVIFNCLLVRSFPFLFVCLFVSCLCICFLLVVIGVQLKVIKLKHFFLYLQARCVYSFSRFDFSYERYCFYLSNLKFSATLWAKCCCSWKFENAPECVGGWRGMMKGSPFTLKASFDVSDRQSKKCLRCGEREAGLSLCHVSPTPLTAMFVHLSTLFLSFLGPFVCIFL